VKVGHCESKQRKVLRKLQVSDGTHQRVQRRPVCGPPFVEFVFFPIRFVTRLRQRVFSDRISGCELISKGSVSSLGRGDERHYGVEPNPKRINTGDSGFSNVLGPHITK